uniref:Reverse transcriptase N-terminal domain-containing protein n=1 Tax=Dictyomenia sonderi TaxID=2007178 RepID=A0A1Z1MT20_9FLOR|nr:hypothetical protein [Dictyomenia sonderi]ARW69096.1 hypothetical protein [Dictyomenia sonderi]
MLMIKKQLYIAMKKYNLIRVYQLQQYIINCNEAKLMLINKIFRNLILYYSNCKNIKLLINNINKLDILSSLIVKKLHSNQLNYIVIEYVKQNLVYISIEPTWTAKISKKLTEFIKTTRLQNSLSTSSKTNEKYFLTTIVIKKLGSYNYINKSISKWLYKNVCLNLSKIYNLKYKEYVLESRINALTLITKNSECLYMLINKVVINDLYWHIFNYARISSNFCKEIDNTQLVILDNNQIINNLLKTFNIILKKLLYRKTDKGFNKINTFNNNVLNKLKFLYQYYYLHLISFIFIDLIERCNKLVNCFTYILIRKQISTTAIKSKYIYKLKIMNQILNQFIYFCNIKHFYKHA